MSRVDHTACNTDARKRREEARRELAAAAPEPTCVFPDCRYDARPDHPTCDLHRDVTVTGSWVPDRHKEN